MNVLTLKAHYDGERICLDEPVDLPPDTPLVVAVFQADDAEAERADWTALAKKALARAYADDEPDYPSDMVREKPSQ
ncbi:MAG: hypothetical protein DME25_10110 [Verrucomicrobia bacterium]|nr:MAG: hypothetical protein DME25_10110 [Verrucomicrobiota bacterium]